MAHFLAPLMQKILHSLAFAITGSVAFCMLFLQVFPILHDYPEWMYQGWIFSQLLSGDNTALSERFELVTYPVPNIISQVVIGLLNFSVTPVMAGKLWLGLYFVAASALWFRVSQLRGGPAAGALHLLLTVMITLGPGFWNGYLNFQVALLLFALAVHLTVSGKRYNGYMVCGFSLLLFFSHAVVFAAFVGFSLLVGASIHRRYWLYTMVALLPSLLLAMWYAAIRLANPVDDDRSMSVIEWVQYKAYTLAKQGPFHNFIGHDGKSGLEELHWLYQVGFISNFLVAILLICWFIWLCWWLIQKKLPLVFQSANTARENWLVPVVVTIGLLLAGFLAGSQNTFGVVNIGERFLIIGMLLVLMFFRCPEPLRHSLVVICVIFSFYSLTATYLLSRKSLEIYAVERSSEISDLQQYLGNIYASTRHKHFNHRVFIYADRGVELTHDEPVLLAVDLETSVIRNRH